MTNATPTDQSWPAWKLVLRVSDFKRSQEWYRSRFGFLVSDEVYLGDPENVVTAFMQIGRAHV